MSIKHSPNPKALKSAAIFFLISGTIFIILTGISGKMAIFLPVGIALIVLGIVFWQSSKKIYG